MARTVLRGDHRSNAAVLPDTGWNAALLAHRLGAGHVTTVELDKDVAQRARQALLATGAAPNVVVTDGEQGWPTGGPYARIIATCAARTIPRPWVEQTRPGGIIVAPLHAGAVVKLTVHEDRSANGAFISGSSFMLSRPQRDRMTDVRPGTQGWKSPTGLRPDALGQLGFVLYVYARHPELYVSVSGVGDVRRATVIDGEGSAAQADGSGWAWEYGPRALWEELELLWDAYRDHGSPDPARFGLTVTRTSQHVWLDDPRNVL